MYSTIIKRDGRVVEFSKAKIYNAIKKAAEQVGFENWAVIDKLSELVIDKLDCGDRVVALDVEEIQDAVEKVLMENGYTDIAKKYILYRAERARVREAKTELMQTYKWLILNEPKLSAKKKKDANENANIDDDTPMGAMLRCGSEGMKRFNHLHLLDKEASDAHKNGDIHIHDLDFYALTTTCAQIDLNKLFKGGFSTGDGFLREPNSIRSFSALTCIVIQSNQNDQHGGQSIPAIDWYMAPGIVKTFIKKIKLVIDIKYSSRLAERVATNLEYYTQSNSSILNESGLQYAKNAVACVAGLTEREATKIVNKAIELTDKEAYQAMEAMIHNLNTMHSRAGAQVPFSSINYGTDTSEEGRMVTKNILLATDAGLGNGETPIFPIQIFKLKEGINYNKEDRNYDLFKLACKVSAKRLYPNFSNLDAPFNSKYYKEGNPNTEVAYMGCRTRVIGNVYDPSREIVTGRGNLSFTSINLPRIAIEAGKDNLEGFYDLINDRLELVVRQLDSRFKIQCNKIVKNFPFLMGQGVWLDSDKLETYDKVAEVLKHGTLSVGFIGLAEALKVLTGKHHGESKEAQKLGIEIISYMRRYLDNLSKERKMNYTLLATPAEGLSGRFVEIDRVKYGVIEGVTDKEYYTNSFHVPVYYPISAFDKIDIEAPYHELTNAGHITYIELDGDTSKNLKAFEKVVRYMHDKGLGYVAVNHPVDRDMICGYTGVINEECPGCGRKADNKIERIRRITGYLVGNLDRFNAAKRAEERDRVKHKV